MKKIVCLLFILCSQAHALNFKPMKDGPIHEAYAVQEFGTLLLETVPNQPPHLIIEQIPNKNDPETIWIPGYWAWSHKHGQFLWVSGVWRRPPPGRQWVPGFWKSYDDGWVWMRGFWSPANLKKFSFIPTPSPDLLDEKIPEPPSTLTNYFWAPGYWDYDFQNKRYVWYAGRWEAFHPHWMYVPPQYIWREEGYLLNSAFWDWPIDYRGLLFSPISVTPDVIDSLVYEPSVAFSQAEMLEALFPYWPSYMSLFHYVYNYHQEAWETWGAPPPWWDWPAWWSFTGSDSWWLWWWWTHPGYPNPFWIDSKLSSSLTPPPSFVIQLMQGIQPPANVTPNGVVGTQKIIEALETVSGKKEPILPADPKQVLQIQEVANPKTKEAFFLQPQGTQKVTQPLPKPTIASPPSENVQQMVLPPHPTLAPKIPTQPTEVPGQFQISQLDPPMDASASPAASQESLPPAPTPRLRLRRHTPPALHPRLPAPTPHSDDPYSQPTRNAERPIPQPRGPQRNLPIYVTPEQAKEMPHISPQTPQTQMQIMQMQSLPYGHIPIHGYKPPTRRFGFHYEKYERIPMEAQHHDYLMIQPQPQVNPPGPRVYETPGDYSTLPGA